MHNNGYLDHYHEYGYAVIKSVFGPCEVQELADAFERVYQQALSHHASYRHQNVYFQLALDEALGRIVRYVQWPAYFDDVLARYRTDWRMLDILAPLLGMNLKQIVNQMHWKPAGARNSEFGYHQDIHSRRPRWAYRDPALSYVQTGIAIDPHRRSNGAMSVLPGSHKLGELTFNCQKRVMDRPLSDADLEALGVDPSDKVDLVLDPGDVALWHLNLIHGSGPNLTEGTRRFYVNGYVMADSCARGEWAFRKAKPCSLGAPVLVHNELLYEQPEPHYVE
jgi:ectoine hydroxylase-related dioxygenase (phytanoyl-CoA dioxygenase family)